MSLLSILFVLLVLAAIVAVVVLVRNLNRPPGSAVVHLPPEPIEFDKTRIEQIYGHFDASPLVGFVDPATKTVFVRETETERVQRVLRAEPSGDKWDVNHPEAPAGLYEVKGLDEAQFQRPVSEGLVFALGDRKCYEYAKDVCVNFYSGNRFVYSWKPVADVWLCAASAGDDCTETNQNNNVTLYPQKDCKGTPYQSDETWSYCSPV